MINKLKQFTATAILALGYVTFAQAVPTLQLDIAGGTYDLADETIITTDSAFTLYAYATPGNVSVEDILADTYYLSIAVTPKLTDATDLGTIYVNGTAIDVTADMIFGTPPLDVIYKNMDLPSHDIYETYYAEIAFTFDPDMTTSIYNVQDNPGTGIDGGTGMFYTAFDIDASGLDSSVGLHFDLYNTALKSFRNGDVLKLDDFAPFSHDAAMVRDIPEPATLWLTSLGLLGLFGVTKKRKAHA